jgi:hypothetical protein
MRHLIEDWAFDAKRPCLVRDQPARTRPVPGAPAQA